MNGMRLAQVNAQIIFALLQPQLSFGSLIKGGITEGDSGRAAEH